MLSQLNNTQSTFAGIPLSNLPKFKIGDLVEVTEVLPNNITFYCKGKITMILIGESEYGNPDSITNKYSFFVTDSNHKYLINCDSDCYDESNLILL
jgi:hypothetical protein